MTDKAMTEHEGLLAWRALAMQERDRAGRAYRALGKAQAALTELRRHPNGKLDKVAAYYYQLGKEAAAEK